MERASGSTEANQRGTALPGDDQLLLAALRRGDEEAFMQLVDRYQGALVRLAMTFVSRRDVAEEVVQDTWVGVVKGLDGFAGRSSLKTWIFRILVNRARTRGEREGRVVPFADLQPEARGDEPAVDAGAFWPADHPRWANEWVAGPQQWPGQPEERALAGELREVIRGAVEALPPAQRAVVTLRDIEGWGSDEVCNTLDISESNQRVLLHRGRARVRAAIDRYMAPG
jgi:RNA polymerase sigma-70 factor, ECF subfamily